MQLELFNFEDELSIVNEIIPSSVISPLESKRRIMSKPFIEERKVFVSYVTAIQEQHQCSWFKARQLLFEHRDSQQPIKMKKGEKK